MTLPTLYRLADHVVIEPLVASYPAWWCTFSPMPAALHLAGYQLPALRSFIRSPKTHRKAARDPALSGGPFVNLEDEQVPWVKELLATLEREFAGEVRLAADYWEFVAKLFARGEGQTLEPLYAELPDSMRGFVELVYDYHARPFLRLDEGMLYASDAFKTHLQSLRLFVLERHAERPFYMSTPRPPSDKEIDWPIPFDDERTKILLELDTVPRSLEEIRSAMAGATNLELLESMLVPATPRPARATVTEGDVRIDYVGHACVLLETADFSVLVDPFISPPARSDADAHQTSFHDLPERIDVAVITHAHPDHLAFEALLRLRGRVDTLVVPKNFAVAVGDVSLRHLGRHLGFKRVVDLETLETMDLPGGGKLTATPFYGEHGDILHGNKASFLVRTNGRSVLFAADSTCLDTDVFKRLRERYGVIDTVFMNTEINGAPISWPFDALFPKGRNTKLEKTRVCRGSNAEEGLAMLSTLGARRLYNYAMGLEPWLERIVGPASSPTSPRMLESDRLLTNARAMGIEAVRLEGSRAFLLPRD